MKKGEAAVSSASPFRVHEGRFACLIKQAITRHITTFQVVYKPNTRSGNGVLVKEK